METCRKNSPDTFKNLEQNEGTNLTNEPYCLQANDARHEIINKAGQNLYKGETVEVFRKSFTVVDDISAMRSKMFEHSGVNENLGRQQVPNYEPIVLKICIGLRKTGYLQNPLVTKELSSISNKPLNPSLKDLFKLGINARDSDIRNFLRHNDIKLGYNVTNKIEILDEDIQKKKDLPLRLKEIKNEIKIMISLVEDAEKQLYWKQFYNENKEKGEETLKSILNDLTNNKFSFFS